MTPGEYMGGPGVAAELVDAYLNAPSGALVTLAIGWADQHGPLVVVEIGPRRFALNAPQARETASLCWAVTKAAHDAMSARAKDSLLEVASALADGADEIDNRGVTLQ